MKALTIIFGICFVLCVILLAFILGDVLGDSHEILCPDPLVVCGDCIVSVDCCCPTETPTETIVSLSTPTKQATTTECVETIIPQTTHTPVLKHTTVSPTSPHTHAPPTETPIIPTSTPESECYQWICHRTGQAGWINYCCDSQGCVDAKLKHDDLLGKCEEHGITPHDD